MTTRDEPWPQGTPAWADLMVPDRHTAVAFYGGLLGWDFSESGPEYGYYMQALVDGRTVAGVGEAPAGGQAPPSAWTTYLAVDDVEPVVKRAVDAGGTVLMGPMDVAEFGRMAVLADPTGAVFGVWQSGTHTGARLVNEPGCMVWNEVMTRDFDRAKDFYGKVFGYAFGDMSGEGFRYATLDLDGRPVGGLGQLPESVPAEVPAHWMTYFMVPDTDAAVARAAELGGKLQMGPQDTEYGRMAILTGPAGEVFSVMGPAPEGQPAQA